MTMSNEEVMNYIQKHGKRPRRDVAPEKKARRERLKLEKFNENQSRWLAERRRTSDQAAEHIRKISDIIKDERQKQKMTKVELAHRIKRSPQTITRIEGRNTSNVLEYIRALSALNIEIILKPQNNENPTPNQEIKQEPTAQG